MGRHQAEGPGQAQAAHRNQGRLGRIRREQRDHRRRLREGRGRDQEGRVN